MKEEKFTNINQVIDELKKNDEIEEEYIDVDDILSSLANLQKMLEYQEKEIRGLRRDLRDLKDVMQIKSKSKFENKRFSDNNKFRSREHKKDLKKDFKRELKRESKEEKYDREEKNLDFKRAFRPRARVDRGWNKKDE